MKKVSIILNFFLLTVLWSPNMDSHAQSIKACANKASGALRLITAGQICRPTEITVSWTSFDPARIYIKQCITYPFEPGKPPPSNYCSCNDPNDQFISIGCSDLTQACEILACMPFSSRCHALFNAQECTEHGLSGDTFIEHGYVGVLDKIDGGECQSNVFQHIICYRVD